MEQEEKTLSVEEPFSIYAGFATTKTTTSDGTKVSWLKDDAINVFHVETGTTNYVNDGKFTIADVSTGRFTGTLASELEDGKSYDWYLLYPDVGRYNAMHTQYALYTDYSGYRAYSQVSDSGYLRQPRAYSGMLCISQNRDVSRQFVYHYNYLFRSQSSGVSL